MIRVLHVLGGLERGGAESMVMNLYRAIDRTLVQFDFIIHTDKHQAYYDEIISKTFGRFRYFLYLCTQERQENPDLDYVSLNNLIP